MGNLTRDPEVRYTTANQAVAKLSVAVNRTGRGKDGEVLEQVDFIPVVVFGNQAENCERYLRKGRPVLIEGRLQVRSYETGGGERRWVSEVVAQSVIFLGSKRDSSGVDDLDSSSFGERVGSLREKDFGDEFPMDFSEVASDSEEEGEPDIPF